MISFTNQLELALQRERQQIGEENVTTLKIQSLEENA